MAIYTSYNQIGQAEDVSDIISNISPTKTPFQSMIRTGSASARLVEWQEDALAAVRNNKNVEGADASDASLSPTTMRSNYTQILEKTIKLSGTADAIKTYGRDKESAYQLAKAAAEVKRDLEYVMVGLNQAAAVGDASTTARVMATYIPQIHANVTVTTDGNAGTTGTPAGALTEDNVLSLHQKLYTEGADPTTLMIKPADSLIVSNFAAASGRERDFGSGKKVVNAVDLYVSPFGELKVILNRFQITTHAFMFDPDMWELKWLRKWTRQELAKTGDNMKWQLIGEVTLAHKNFKGSGMIANLT